MSASPGYFAVFNIPILRGRDFTEQDTGSAPGVVLINETMAKKFWPKEDPVGQQILIGKGVGPQFEEPARQIIGVVGDIRDGGLNSDPRPLMIVPERSGHRRHDRAQLQHRPHGLAGAHPRRSAPVHLRRHRAASPGQRRLSRRPRPHHDRSRRPAPPRARTSTCSCSPSSEPPR